MRRRVITKVSRTWWKRHTSWAILFLLASACQPRVESFGTETNPNSNHKHHSSASSSSRRDWLLQITRSSGFVVAGYNTLLFPKPAFAVADQPNDRALPSALRDYTKLAPLGKAGGSSSLPKSYQLSLDKIASRLYQDLCDGATGKGSYIITGDLSADIFLDDCVFQDPTNRVRSLSQYQTALTILFDPNQSVVQVLGNGFEIDNDRLTITGRFRSRGVLQLPWHPHVAAYESTIVWTIDPQTGLIAKQDQVWTKSASEALQESFTPSLFDPTPVSPYTNAPSNEPAAVTQLFNMVNGRRVNEYSTAERIEIMDLMTKISNLQEPWDGELLPGTWRLVFIEEGPNGGGVDRRVPFPEFGFNNQYQIFTRASGTPYEVTNVGEVFGPNLVVRVSGSVSERDPGSLLTPKKLQASIGSGQLCTGSSPICLPLPIKGEGLFNIPYLGTRIRLLQNENGGGARGIQVRMS